MKVVIVKSSGKSVTVDDVCFVDIYYPDGSIQVKVPSPPKQWELPDDHSIRVVDPHVEYKGEVAVIG